MSLEYYCLSCSTQAAVLSCLTVGFQELLGMQVALQHALVEQHVAHWLRDDYVNLLRQRHLLHLSWDDNHTVA